MGSQIDIESSDWLEMLASDRISIVVGKTTIVITQTGIEINGDIAMSGNLKSGDLYAPNIEPWDESGGSGDPSENQGDGTITITQFDSEIIVDPLTMSNPTLPITFIGPPDTPVSITHSYGFQLVKTDKNGFAFALINVPYVSYPDGYELYTFSINGKQMVTKKLHIVMTSDPDAPDPNANQNFSVSGLPDSVTIARANGYSGVMNVSMTALPNSKIYISVDWANGSWSNPYPSITDKHGVTGAYFSVMMPPGQEYFTCTFTCDGFSSISQTVTVNMTDWTN
jgi:hypothetical protein